MLAQALRESRWQSPQVIMLGRIECRSPDPLTVTRVGKYEVWHREVRRAILALPRPVQEDIWSYLHAESGMQQVDGKWCVVPPNMHAHHERAFELLWISINDKGFTHTPTREIREPD